MLPDPQTPPAESAPSSAAPSRPSTLSESAPAEDAVSSPPSRPSSLRQSLRLLTFRSTDTTALSGSAVSIAVPALIALVLWAGFDWLNNQPDPQLFMYGVPAIAWYVLGALSVAATLALIARPALSFARACALIALLAPVLVIGQFIVERFVPERRLGLGLVVVAVYAINCCRAGLRSITGSRQLVATAAGAAVAIMAVWLGNVLYVEPALWASGGEADNEYAEDNDWGAAEPILFQQAARIDASVAQLMRPAGETPVGFFVGFAGYGDQKVFAEEVEFASQRFAQRYGTARRTLLLVNDRRSLETHPLASGTALSYALKGVASKMDIERDILFLVLSSHGSEDPLLSVTNGSVPLRDLSGEALAEALRGSGIKWKVIIISACHAGAFIEPLKDERTILITAAAADRSSFGCADDRDLTYFGEAFYRDALPDAASLRAAFEKATVLIAEREAEEGVEASLPQAYFGEQIEKQLAVMSKDGN